MKIRRARREDLPAIVDLLADDALGRTREDSGPPLNASYTAAFDQIAADPHNDLFVGLHHALLHALHILTLGFH